MVKDFGKFFLINKECLEPKKFPITWANILRKWFLIEKSVVPLCPIFLIHEKFEENSLPHQVSLQSDYIPRFYG